MAKLPDVTALGARPTPRPASNVVPRTGAEGIVGQSLRNLGAGLASAGEDIYEHYQREKKRQDDDIVEGGLNDLRRKQNELTLGKNGFLNVQGKDALSDKWQKDYQLQFDDYQAVLADGLQNDEQREQFNKKSEILKTQYYENMLRHRMQETEKHADTVFGDIMDEEPAIASKSWRDDPSIEVSKLRIQSAVDRQGDRKGWDEITKQNAYRKATTKLYTLAIQQAVDNHDIDRAKALYYSHKKDEIDPESYGKIEDLIKAGDTRIESQKLADEITADPNKNLQQSIEEAKKRTTGELQDATVARIKDIHGTRDASAQLVQKQAGDRAWAIYSETKDFDKIPISTLRAMDGKQREELRAYAEKIKAGVGVKTDPVTYYQLRKLYAADNDKFRSLNLMTYQPKLSEGDFQELVKLQTDNSGVKTFKTADQYAKEALVNMGLDPKDELKDSGDGKKIRDFSTRLQNEILQFRDSKGRYPSDQEMKEIIDNQTIKIIKNKSFLWIPYTSEESAAVTKVEGVPDNMLDEYAKALKKAGQPVNEENIKKLHLYMGTRAK